MAYTSMEEQEINAIKSWWNENYKTVILSLAIGIGAVFGWRYWQDHQANRMQVQSAQYERLMADYARDPKQQAENFDAFIQEHANSAYAAFALLEKAKIAVQQEDYAAAQDALTQAINQAPDQIISSVAALRLASVQYQQQQYDAAVESLKQVKDPAWNSRKLLINGNILLAQGNKEGAKNSYQEAMKTASEQENRWLQVRLNNL
ncbi:putative negative regulator of RcsB-dependent stress response [Mesocricetibacter intestinalis]|uniref:Ancillary SecYEG translocon subunit n=1 Tax=Mesocricetibacter intestinalis TaxID=1521930 RepID=A0A4R6VL28_9PAST|nr:tetratricopeptide repeat protein [Mesocricetibacter intestinalis]TDQ59510.1 putative negative regulator of RcsB-dependent stress response [Mesocricetibacter intestinalis]